MTDFYLGTRVIMTGTVQRADTYGTVRYEEAGLPANNHYSEPRYYTSGIITGKRTMQMGDIEQDYWNEPRFFSPSGESITVWLVAFDLHRKPAMCLPHQITPELAKGEE